MSYCDECLDTSGPFDGVSTLCRHCQERRDAKLARQNALETTGSDLIVALFNVKRAVGRPVR